MILSGAYDWFLVALSFAVAALASYTALDLGGRITRSRGLARTAWLTTAAIAMGGGIWSMHFIAMLAFVMPMPVSYDVGLTLLSLLVAIGVTGIAFYVIGTRNATSVQLVMSGLLMGLGIVAMHYTGMLAMRMSAVIVYNYALVATSIFIAIGASIAALWLAFRTALIRQRVLAAFVMGFAICGMHYTAMWAASFSSPGAIEHAHVNASLAQTDLALAVAGATFMILILALTASIFDRKFAVLAEQEALRLRQSEEQLRKLYRETPLPLHTVASDGTVEKVSDAWLSFIGYGRDEVVGRKLTSFMTVESRCRYTEELEPKLRGGVEIKEAEFQFVRKNGEVMDVLLSAHVELVDGNPVRTVAALVDITARKRAEEALLRAQRMEAVGKLTGGVAHDFNNLLMVISGVAEKLKRSHPEESSRKLLDMIGTAVERGQTLTSHLLSFARQQKLEAVVVDLEDELPKLGELLRRSLRGDIEIRVSGSGCPCRVRIDRGEFELALLNLGVNARDAMPDGGILSISVRKCELRGDARCEGLQGEFIAFEVKDTGTGIPPELLPKVFDPFFTTKEHGKGTGLGLSQVYGFAKQSGGTATVQSNVGQGTNVTLYLRITEDQVRDESKELPSVVDADHRQGRALIVEDNEQVAEISASYFERLGYEVEVAPNGAQALRMLQKGRYAVVFSDILMPGSVAGLELARLVREYHSGAAVVLTTGYSERAQQAVEEGFPVLQKPFNLSSLAKLLHDVRSRHAALANAQAGSGEAAPSLRLASGGASSP